jgi:hypothetical protein
MLYLKDIEDKIVDLTKSVVDVGDSGIKEKDWKAIKKALDEGGAKFVKKVYYEYKIPLSQCPYHFGWSAVEPSGMTINKWKTQMGYSFVTENDPYYPEGLTKNEEGHYQMGDSVLMRCPVLTYIQRKMESMKRADDQLRSTKEKFATTMKQAGAGLTAADEELIARRAGLIK